MTITMFMDYLATPSTQSGGTDVTGVRRVTVRGAAGEKNSWTPWSG
jgi:hypothetical protein